MKCLQIDGLSFAVIDEGVGEVLVFLHGFPLNKSMWFAQVEAFSATHRVIVPDLRGHGQSEVNPNAAVVTMREMAEDVAKILDGLQVEHPVTVCGLSMGGYVAWEFWRQYRERLGGLVMADTRASKDSEEVARARKMMAAQVVEAGAALAADSMIPKMFAPQTYVDLPEVVESVRQMMLSTDPRAIGAAQRGMAERTDMTDLLSDIRTPTLLLCGAEDSISVPDEMKEIARQMPNSSYAEVPGAGHLAPLERPRQVNDIIRQFLAANSSGDGYK